jgi:mannitol operon repressor
MPRKKTPYKPNAELLKKHPHLHEFFPFLHDLSFESDRGQVLLCCAYLDDLLRDTLKAFFIEGSEADRLLEGFNAPIGTFSARVTTAYCCGLISELEHRELTILRKIRNEFAHSKTAAFSDKKISDLCANLALSVPDIPGNRIVAPSPRFGTAAIALIAQLTNRPHYIRKQRRSQPKNPPMPQYSDVDITGKKRTRPAIGSVRLSSENAGKSRS